MKSTFLSRKTNTSDRRTTLSVSYLVSALAVVGMVACTTTVTPAPDSCGVNSSVVCSSGTGWSCTGDAQPEDTNSGLVCSTDGVGDFCCDQSACAYDSTISCVTGAAGYSCAIGSSPLTRPMRRSFAARRRSRPPTTSTAVTRTRSRRRRGLLARRTRPSPGAPTRPTASPAPERTLRRTTSRGSRAARAWGRLRRPTAASTTEAGRGRLPKVV